MLQVEHPTRFEQLQKKHGTGQCSMGKLLFQGLLRLLSSLVFQSVVSMFFDSLWPILICFSYGLTAPKKTTTTAIFNNSGQYLAASQLLQLLGFQEHIGQILHNDSNYGIRINQ